MPFKTMNKTILKLCKTPTKAIQTLPVSATMQYRNLVWALVCSSMLVWLSPNSSLAAGSAHGASSDPVGSGRPANRENPVLSALSTRFFVHGYYRMRTAVLNQLDLGYGLTASTKRPLFPMPAGGGNTIYTSDMRLRLDLSMEVGRSVKVITRIDGLDNIVLGSTPLGFPTNRWVPSSVATPGQNSPFAGQNALTDSIRIRRAYGEVLLPLGYVAAGRMGALIPWGLGMTVYGGQDLDADNADDADRIALTLPLLGHLLTFAYDFSASGPVLGTSRNSFINAGPIDDVRSYGLAVARYDTPAETTRKLREGQWVVNYGLIASYRGQSHDLPQYYENGKPDGNTPTRPGQLVERNAWSMLFDLWFLWRTSWLRIEMEAVYTQGYIENSSPQPGVRLTQPLTSNQFGGVLQTAVAPPEGPWGLGLEIGIASGDDAPGFGVRTPKGQLRTRPGDLDGPQIDYPNDTTVNNFRFHPDYRVDQIFWRRIVGQITDAVYIKGSTHFDITPRLRVWSALIYSRTMEAASAPGGVSDLGIEFNAGLRYDYDPGFETRLTFGAFFPFEGLQNPKTNTLPQPALALQLVLGYVF